jgi:hypothetical protein
MTLIKEVNCMVLAFFDLCCYVRFYKESLPIISVRHHSYDPDGKTTVELLNKNLEVLMIDSYSQVTAYCNHIEHLYYNIRIKFINKVSCVMQLMDILEGVVGTGWNWLRIGTDGGHLWVW